MNHNIVNSSVGSLTAPEHRLVMAAKTGDILKLEDNETVRAIIVQALACGEREDWPVAPEGVRLKGGKISGHLNCSHRVLHRSLWLDSTNISDGIDLTNAQTRTLSFDGSFIGGINAQEIRIDGGLFLRNAKLEGNFDINGSTISGQLSAKGAIFNNPGKKAIDAQRANLCGLFLEKATIRGSCHVSGTVINGQFSAPGAIFENPDGYAINAQAGKMTDLFLNNCSIKGECFISGIEITGQLAGVGATFENANGDALYAEGARIGSVFLISNDEKSSHIGEIKGTIVFQRAIISQHFEISNANIIGGPLGAIQAANIEVAGQLIIGFGTRIEGAIVLSGAEIRGCLDLTGSHLTSHAIASNPASCSIVNNQLWFTAIDLSEAQVSQIIMPDPADVRHSICARPRGIVDLSRARVGTLTDFASGWPEAAAQRDRSCPGRIRDAEGHDADHLVLDGFEYQHLDNPDGNAADGKPANIARLRWLRAQSCDDLFVRLRPQPWRHLASTLAAQGYEDEARRIAIARRVAQRYASGTSQFTRAVSWLLHLLADYGFNPWKAMAWSGGVILLCAALYGVAAATYCTDTVPRCADGTVFVRTTAADFVPGIDKVEDAEQTLAKIYPAFDPLAYSFDVFLPFFDIGTERFWRVNTTTWWGVALYYFTVLEQIAGALLISLIVTGFTGLLTRTET